MEQKLDFHLFGSLWLEQPSESLTSEELEQLMQQMQLIEQLKNRKPFNTKFDFSKLFADFVEEETHAWIKNGVRRDDRLLVQHSANASAPLACHLHNPSFYTADPFCQNLDDETNISVCQVRMAGMDAQKCFFFDHIARRDRSGDAFKYYLEEIIEIHEKYMLALRKNMNALVEICWGKQVETRMKSLLHLIPLRLWGIFSEVELFIEVNTVIKEPVRFLIFVKHPQRFMYAPQQTPGGKTFRGTEGRTQDLHLTVAARIAGVTIDEHFYETTHSVGTYGRLNQAQQKVCDQQSDKAITELKRVSPQKFRQKKQLHSPFDAGQSGKVSAPVIRVNGYQPDEYSKAPWASYFLRSWEECNDLPQSVILQCQTCRTQTYEDTNPQWTSEDHSRYVERRPRCQTCQKKNTTWKPTDKGIPSMTSANLSRRWRRLQDGGLEAETHTASPFVLYPRHFTTTKLKLLSEGQDELVRGPLGTQRERKGKKWRLQEVVDENDYHTVPEGM